MDLMDALPGMSWRQFLVLVRGLSPQSALWNEINARKPRKKHRGSYDEPVTVIDADANPEAFDEFWRSMVPKPRNKKNGLPA